MGISAQTQAILLLTTYFSKAQKGDAKPLGPVEWGRFATWLKSRDLSPEDLLRDGPAKALDGWNDRTISTDRITALLERGAALGLAMEKWQRAGLWVITRADAQGYPRRLKQQLENAAPPIFFGCGEKNLLALGGVAVVGSRRASPQDLAYAKRLGDEVASAGYSIISGGAKGIDEAAMSGALAAGGTVVGVMADSLLRACASSKYRKSLMNGDLALISPYFPESGFNAGNAMGRNKYIYCLSYAAVVVHSGTNGGTWSGAMEALRKKWVPVWVKPTTDSAAGNSRLVDAGGHWLSEALSDATVRTILGQPETVAPKVETESASVRHKDALLPEDVGCVGEIRASVDSNFPGGARAGHSHVSQEPPAAVEPMDTTADPAAVSTQAPAMFTFYELFLIKVANLCKDDPKTVDQLVEALDLEKVQLNEWLKQAVREKRMVKLSRPVRYRWENGNERAAARQIAMPGFEADSEP